MGVWFDDPDIEIEDIYWYNLLAKQIKKSLRKNEGFISVDREYKTKSCYVELHRNGDLNSVGYFNQILKKRQFSSPIEATQLD